MLVAAAFCPCPPLLVPHVAAGAAPELDRARAACADALGVLTAARPDRLIVVGPSDEDGPTRYPAGTPGSFRGFGVDIDVVLGTARGGSEDPDQGLDHRPTGGELPASLAVAAWLLSSTRWSAADISGLALGERLDTARCARAGRDIAGQPGRTALLVMGDAGARRSLKAPGYLDERAARFDEGVARAMESADIAALLGLDAELARDLMVAGRAPWQLVAGAAEAAGLGGELLYDDAPYGVGYLVAAWS